MINKNNYKLIIEYDGTNYCGWQAQKNGLSIQEIIQNAVKKVTGEQTPLYGSGRTDSGVHAIAQVANFKTSSKIPPDKLLKGINTYIPKDIRLKKIVKAGKNFHARYSAKSKIYKYLIFNGLNPPVFNIKYCWPIIYKLDLKKIISGAKVFEGKHNFKGFSKKKKETQNYIRTIYFVNVKHKGNWITVKIQGNGFLHNMVRYIVGALVEVGKNKVTNTEIKRVLLTGNREFALETAPAKGLFMERVLYR